ncbi:putative Lytic transglycosylase [Burkholderiales bacterium GJ-E10]|nr:putative Lytic transglycosylase [Burkholderiales bacterium GJ-E10]
MTPIQLIALCAPAVAPVTMAAIVQQESGGNPLALHDNTTGRSYQPQSAQAAATLLRGLMGQGHSVDIGLAQVNSQNLSSLGLDPASALDPCENLRAAQKILLDAWQRSGSLPSALSAYNTGTGAGSRGAAYAAAVYSQAGVSVPAIANGRMAKWAAASASLPPVKPVITWTPQASPLTPNAGDLGVPTSNRRNWGLPARIDFRHFPQR